MSHFWYFWFFNELFSTQNVNVARFARNVECDFLDDFQTLCTGIHRKVGLPQKCAPYEQAPFSALRNVTAFIDVAGNFPSHHILHKHQADKFTTKEKHGFWLLQQRWKLKLRIRQHQRCWHQFEWSERSFRFLGYRSRSHLFWLWIFDEYWRYDDSFGQRHHFF